MPPKKVAGAALSCPATELIQRYAKASGSLEKDDERGASAACEMGKEVLIARAASFVGESKGMPLLTCKSADWDPCEDKRAFQV